ncbi:MAG TPA: AAA family ATPase [Ktedonobacterales bacterium]|nr:AAA family ATPase [Ktedonobacterales bacterium]
MSHQHAFTLVITGPAGAGKSATAEAWAQAQSHPTAHVSLDTVREFLCAGYADPRDGWTPEVDRQYQIARSLCADIARRYVSEGITCVIDDAVFPLWDRIDFTSWRRVLGETPAYLIALLPSYETVVERNASRHGRRLLEPPLLRTIYDMMLPWREQRETPTIDTSSLSISETADEIARVPAHLRQTEKFGVR